MTLPQKYKLEYQSKLNECHGISKLVLTECIRGYSFGLEGITDFTTKIQVFAHRVTVPKNVMLAALQMVTYMKFTKSAFSQSVFELETSCKD